MTAAIHQQAPLAHNTCFSEKDNEAIKQAVQRYDIHHPVVVSSDSHPPVFAPAPHENAASRMTPI